MFLIFFCPYKYIWIVLVSLLNISCFGDKINKKESRALGVARSKVDRLQKQLSSEKDKEKKRREDKSRANRERGDIKRKEHSYTDKIRFRISNRDGMRLDGEIYLVKYMEDKDIEALDVDREIVRYDPLLDNGEYFFDVPEGIYKVFVYKPGYLEYCREVVFMEDISSGKIRYIGDLDIVLEQKNLATYKISAENIKELVLIGEKNVVVHNANGYLVFNQDHIGRYKANINGVTKEVHVYVLDNQIRVDIDNKVVQTLYDSALNIIISCDQTLITQIDTKIVSIDFELAAEDKDKRYDIVNKSFYLLGNKLILNFEISSDIEKEIRIHPTLTLKIGEFELEKKLVIEYDGAFKNLICDEFVLEDRYYITNVRLSKDVADLAFEISSDNQIYYKYKDKILTIHSFGKPTDITISFDSFRPYVFSCTETERGYQLKGEELTCKVSHSLSLIRQEQLNIPKSSEGTYQENYLVIHKGDRYNVLEKLDDVEPVVFFPDVPEESLYILVIDRDIESNEIVRQRLANVENSMVNRTSNKLNLKALQINSKYLDKQRLDGVVFLNLNNISYEDMFNKAKAVRSNISNLVIKIYHYNTPGDYLKLGAELPGANIDVRFNNGAYELNFDPNYCIYEFGNVLAVDLYRCNPNFSKIDKTSPANQVIRLQIIVYAVDSVEDLELSHSVPITGPKGELLDVKEFFKYSRYYEPIYRCIDEVSPLFSSQTFILKLSYGKSPNVLSESCFYPDCLLSGNGDSKLIVSSDNVSKGRFGQNFGQYVQLEKGEQKESGMAFGLVGLAGLLTGNLFTQALSLGAILFGTMSALSADNSNRHDTQDWRDNFVDSNGRVIDKINDSGQKDYAIEWSMYVRLPYSDFVFKSSTIQGGEAKIRVIRKIIELSGRLAYVVTESNDGVYNSSKPVDLDMDNWYLFKCKLDKAGAVSNKWSVNIPIPFKVYRHTTDKLDNVSTLFYSEK